MSKPIGTRLFWARKAATDAAAAARNCRREAVAGLRGVIESSSGEGSPHFVEKRGHFLRLAAAQRLERHKASESDLVDDFANSRKIDRRLLSVHIDELFDLPRAGIRHQLFDLFVGIALAHAAHVE